MPSSPFTAATSRGRPHTCFLFERSPCRTAATAHADVADERRARAPRLAAVLVTQLVQPERAQFTVWVPSSHTKVTTWHAARPRKAGDTRACEVRTSFFSTTRQLVQRAPRGAVGDANFFHGATTRRAIDGGGDDDEASSPSSLSPRSFCTVPGAVLNVPQFHAQLAVAVPSF